MDRVLCLYLGRKKKRAEITANDRHIKIFLFQANRAIHKRYLFLGCLGLLGSWHLSFFSLFFPGAPLRANPVPLFCEAVTHAHLTCKIVSSNPEARTHNLSVCRSVRKSVCLAEQEQLSVAARYLAI